MNLAFNFLKYLPDAERKQIAQIPLKGISVKLLALMQEQLLKEECDRDRLIASLHVSSAHFDKLSSELLSKCYACLFQEDGMKLLSFLSTHVVFVKHFYVELNRQTRQINKLRDKKIRAEFNKSCFNFIHHNMPIMYKDEAVLKKLAANYLKLEHSKNAQMLMQSKLIYVQIDKLFASGQIQQQQHKVQRKINDLGRLSADADEELVFVYYWTQIYFCNALEDFSRSLETSKQALAALSIFKTDRNQLHTLRIELKVAELLYYLSQFEESFTMFKRLMNSERMNDLPDFAYYNTKFIQICLISGNLQDAKAILTDKMQYKKPLYRQAMPPRDIISYAKYFLFSGDYEEAFRFIQLGFEKNPKGKYFQYEVELRNLQTAYFFLSNQKALLPALCNRHIKYLRSHDYTVKNSNFPYFYVLTKAMLASGKKLSLKEKQVLDRYQLGSYAVYGKLLLKMMAA